MLKVCFCAKQVDGLTASLSDFDVKKRFHKTSHMQTVHTWKFVKDIFITAKQTMERENERDGIILTCHCTLDYIYRVHPNFNLKRC
jgi:hypothetical protein